jgi:hypothetical protein
VQQEDCRAIIIIGKEEVLEMGEQKGNILEAQNCVLKRM